MAKRKVKKISRLEEIRGALDLCLARGKSEAMPSALAAMMLSHGSAKLRAAWEDMETKQRDDILSLWRETLNAAFFEVELLGPNLEPEVVHAEGEDLSEQIDIMRKRLVNAPEEKRELARRALDSIIQETTIRFPKNDDISKAADRVTGGLEDDRRIDDEDDLSSVAP
ncbi:MAG: hypothetical protein ACXABY_01650 [Candidatus Thorarchaeota archaeon]|jgi:hypothetical protein